MGTTPQATSSPPCHELGTPSRSLGHSANAPHGCGVPALCWAQDEGGVSARPFQSCLDPAATLQPGWWGLIWAGAGRGVRSTCYPSGWAPTLPSRSPRPLHQGSEQESPGLLASAPCACGSPPSHPSLLLGSASLLCPQNGNQDNPSCCGIDGILEAYHQSLRTVQLYGPTNFAPVVTHVAR